LKRRELAWTILDSTQVADCRIFTVHRNLSRRPESTETYDFYVLRCSNWVQVIPMTKEGDVILVEQYRPGTNSVTLETPGGIIDPTDGNSKQAGARELLEETGYRAEKMILIGRTHPNPPVQGNYCDIYLATNIELIQKPSFDKYEDIELRLVPYKEIPGLISSGAISHALVVAAFYYLSLYEQSQLAG
jgi:8-oxo-dGTP pyrophosphatase MutT (NUDIX family)